VGVGDVVRRIARHIVCDRGGGELVIGNLIRELVRAVPSSRDVVTGSVDFGEPCETDWTVAPDSVEYRVIKLPSYAIEALWDSYHGMSTMPQWYQAECFEHILYAAFGGEEIHGEVYYLPGEAMLIAWIDASGVMNILTLSPQTNNTT